jgi:hypothetical protein
MTTGSQVLSRIIETSGTSVHSRSGQLCTAFEPGDTGPARLIPIAQIDESARISSATIWAMLSANRGRRNRPSK